MKLEIKEQKKNPLLNRTEIEGVIEFDDKTPSRIEVKAELAKKAKAKEDLVVISHIYTSFGARKARVIANVYDDAESMKKLERKNLIEKNVPKVEEKKEETTEEAKPEAAEKPAEKKEEAPEAKPEEEKKEEAPAEEKAEEKKEEPKSE